MGTPVLQITGRNLGPIFTIDSTVEDPAAKENVVNRDTPLLHINGIEVGNSIDIPLNTEQSTPCTKRQLWDKRKLVLEAKIPLNTVNTCSYVTFVWFGTFKICQCNTGVIITGFNL